MPRGEDHGKKRPAELHLDPWPENETPRANGVTLLAKFDGDFAGRSNTYAGTGTFRYRW
jgi:hypothetical protein